MNYYSRDVMIREGIPFVWEGHQIYLPFIGMLINENKRQAVYDFFIDVFGLDRTMLDESKITIEPDNDLKSLYK